MNADAKIERIKSFHELFLTHTETFSASWENDKARLPLGVELSYLFVAVADDDVIDVWPRTSSLLPWIRSMRLIRSHPIWKYIRIKKES